MSSIGHWIRNCPTNLDPRYDQAPSRDYRCTFCGLQGAHFATLCEKNPHLSSLAKQRENTVVEIRESRTPSRGKWHHYQDRESSTTRFQGRYRSRTPEQQHPPNQYRSRSREYPHYHRSEASFYSPGARDENDRRWPRRNDESDVSPYTTRARLTQERRISSDTYEGSKSPWDYSLRFKRRPSTPPSPRHYSSRCERKAGGRHKDLDKVTSRSDEGRLAYDDEIDAVAGPISSPYSLIDRSSQHVSADSISGEEVTGPTISPVMIAPEGIINVEDETDNFLRALATEIMLEGEHSSRPMIVNDHDVERDVDSSPATAICIENSYLGTAVNLERPALQAAARPNNQLVRCPPFSPKIVSLFNARENPIINTRASRQTASQMIERSEGFWRSCSDYASRRPLPILP